MGRTASLLLLLLLSPRPAAPGGVHLQVIVVSEWDHLQLRLNLRRAFQACAPALGPDHSAEVRFFMGAPQGTAAGEEGALEEGKVFGDLVILGGPDHDEPDPPGHAAFLQVLQEPSARAFRVVRALAWLLEHRPDFEYVLQLRDTSFVQLPRLLDLLAANEDASLAMGRFVEPPLTVGSGEEEEQVCETCVDAGMELQEKVCLERTRAVPGGMDFRGCLVVARRCCPGDGSTCDTSRLEACIGEAHSTGYPAAVYYGTALAPKSLHGSAWVLGRRPAEFIGMNYRDLKLRGMPDVLMGFWLASLEDVHFVELPPVAFRELPPLVAASGGADEGAEECSAGLLVASGMDLSRWSSWFDPASCELRCGAEPMR